MEFVVAAVLIVLSAAFVALPFVRPEEFVPTPTESPSGIALQDAQRHKADAYAAIKEAEFDFEMGKLSDGDFAALRDKYSAQALEAIGVLDTDKPVAPKTARHSGRVAFCPQCGSAAVKDANFCAACGTNLKQLAA